MVCSAFVACLSSTSNERKKKSRLAASTTCCTNLLNVSVDVWINGGGPFAWQIEPGGSINISVVHVDPNTTKNPSWSASHAFVSREERRSSSIFAAKAHTVVTVAQGKLERRGGAWLPIIIDRASSTILTGGLDYPDLLRLIDVQHHWRSLLRDRREERAKLRRMASIRIQASLRGRLARKLTTCFICMEEVPYSAKVSTVPAAKCHRVCFTCARQYVDSAIADGRLFIRCPGEACTHLMDSSAFCSPAALTTYRANLKNSHERRLDGETDAAFVAFCREHARACPACGVIIWRYAGCDHMHCRCGHHFQWTDRMAIVQERTTGTDQMSIVQKRTTGTGHRAEVPCSAGPSVNVPVGGRPGGPAREELIVDRISVSVNISDDDGGAAAFLRIPGNEVCIDCNTPRPTWASLSLGCALCISCAGLHRGLGVQTSYVRSLALDDLSREDAATLRRSGGNASLIAFARDLDAVTTWEAISSADRRLWYTTTAADVYRRRLATLRAEVRADLAAEANADGCHD